MSPESKRGGLGYVMPILWLAGVLALAGLLAPLFWWSLSGVLDYPFSRFTNRALMVAALIGLIPYLITHWRTLGLRWNQKNSLRFLLTGLVLGILAEVAILAFHLANGSRLWREEAFRFDALIGAVAAGAAVGLLEEIIFRGVAQGALIRRFGMAVGLVVASAFYAIVHYVKVPREFSPDPVTITSGWQALGLAFAPLAEAGTWLDLRLLNLFLVGLLLGMVYLRTGSLWMSIGLHAGFVMMIKMANKTTTSAQETTHWLAVAPDITDSSVTLVALFLLGGVVLLGLPAKSSQRFT